MRSGKQGMQLIDWGTKSLGGRRWADTDKEIKESEHEVSGEPQRSALQRPEQQLSDKKVSLDKNESRESFIRPPAVGLNSY